MISGIVVLNLILSVSAERGRVILIRHAEKNGKAKETGDIHLSHRGEVRAAALARFFFPNNTAVDNDAWNEFERPVFDSIFAEASTKSSPSFRKIETAEPIAREAKLEIQQYERHDTSNLADRLRSESKDGKTSLVVWDHTTIGYLASNLLGLSEDTIKWPLDRYDVIWEIDLHDKTLTQYCQHLLFGDLWCPVNPVQVYPVTKEYIRSMNAQSDRYPLTQ